MSYHGGPLVGQGGVTEPLGRSLEPTHLSNPTAVPYLNKFVAGPTRLESNPLSEPLRNLKTQSP